MDNTTRPQPWRSVWCTNPKIKAAEGETGAARKTKKTSERACITCSGVQRLRTVATAEVGSSMASASTQYLRRVAPESSKRCQNSPTASNAQHTAEGREGGGGKGREGGAATGIRPAWEPSTASGFRKCLTLTHDLQVPVQQQPRQQL